jgi:hypothetical protein
MRYEFSEKYCSVLCKQDMTQKRTKLIFAKTKRSTAQRANHIAKQVSIHYTGRAITMYQQLTLQKKNLLAEVSSWHSKTITAKNRITLR